MNEWLDNIRSSGSLGNIISQERIKEIIEDETIDIDNIPSEIRDRIIEELQNYENDTCTSTVHQDSEINEIDLSNRIPVFNEHTENFFVPESSGNNEIGMPLLRNSNFHPRTSVQPIPQYVSGSINPIDLPEGIKVWGQKTAKPKEKENILPEHLFYIEE